MPELFFNLSGVFRDRFDLHLLPRSSGALQLSLPGWLPRKVLQFLRGMHQLPHPMPNVLGIVDLR